MVDAPYKNCAGIVKSPSTLVCQCSKCSKCYSYPHICKCSKCYASIANVMPPHLFANIANVANVMPPHLFARDGKLVAGCSQEWLHFSNPTSQVPQPTCY